MRLKRVLSFVCAATLIFIIFTIYSLKHLTKLSYKKLTINEDFEDNKWLHFENRIKQLEQNLNKHNDDFNEIKFVMKNMIQQSSTSTSLIRNISSLKIKPIAISEILYESSCSIQINSLPQPNIQMLELYKTMSFDNIDGGVWKQGWKIEINEKDWNRKNKLKVFVVPHSHNDPGWIKTFEEYYLSQTKHILNNMINKLSEDKRRKFIWAEISFFSMWWDELNDDEREQVKRLVRNNQLEIVTGGWVMNDEANSHWISILQQLTEGHQWLKKHLNYTPVSSWSIDPFGMTLTQPFLLKKMGLNDMLIQRVHYSVKRQLASKQQLEFRWRQLWDGNGKTDMFTHMMPFYSYDIPHTCGPDPKICCQFDFKRLPGYGLQCPWKIAPQEINDNNIAQKVDLLLDQYRKKSKLFKTNVILAPLGDDFRYDHPTEWDVQYNNYQKLFDYMNSKLNLNVHAQFGTLNDYFNALHKEKQKNEFPTLSGDFFTYADRDDHYWSGYYTSRPFYKRMDRILLSYIKTAEIILSMAHLSGYPGASWIMDNEIGLEKLLIDSRRILSLFQHHDGITGTSKNHVVIDYGKKLFNAILNCQRIIQHSTHILLKGKDAEDPEQKINFYYLDDIRNNYNSIGERQQITIGPELRTKKIVIFNSLTFNRMEVVTFYISTPFVEILNFQGKKVKCQISPIFEYGSTMSLNKYKLSFIANIPAYGLISYTINALWEHEIPSETVYATIKIFNHYDDIQVPNGFSKPEVSPSTSEFTLQNNRITASFNKYGLLKAIKIGMNTIPVHLDFAKYGVRQTVERSGAYLFLPDEEAKPIKIENTIVNIITGSILSSVIIQLPYIKHIVTLYNSPGSDSLGIEIENFVDITKTSNFELSMRLSTNIQNNDEFFTDLNGYQIIRRRYFKKLPLQANYYPMPSLAYIEDTRTRLTILTGSPLGCSSLKPGQIEIMLDRRLNQDDNLGLGQGIMDNQPVKHIFNIILERKIYDCHGTINGHPAGFPTLSTYVASQTLLNPLVRLLRNEDDDTISKSAYLNIDTELGVDLSISSIRNVILKEQNYLGIIFHRQFIDVCYSDRTLLKQFPLSTGTINIKEIFPSIKTIHKSSLSFLYVKDNINGDIPICPMDIKAFLITY